MWHFLAESRSAGRSSWSQHTPLNLFCLFEPQLFQVGSTMPLNYVSFGQRESSPFASLGKLKMPVFYLFFTDTRFIAFHVIYANRKLIFPVRCLKTRTSPPKNKNAYDNVAVHLVPECILRDSNLFKGTCRSTFAVLIKYKAAERFDEPNS